MRVEDYMSKATTPLPAIAFEETAEPMSRTNIRQRRGTPVTAQPDAEPVEPRMTNRAGAHEPTRSASSGWPRPRRLLQPSAKSSGIDREHDVAVTFKLSSVAARSEEVRARLAVTPSGSTNAPSAARVRKLDCVSTVTPACTHPRQIPQTLRLPQSQLRTGSSMYSMGSFGELF